MKDNQVVFRRINGRVVPIRTSGGQPMAKKPRKQSKMLSGTDMAQAASFAASTTAAGTQASIMGANRFLTKTIEGYSRKLEKFPKIPNPDKPLLKSFEVKQMMRADKEFGGVPLGKVNAKNIARMQHDAAMGDYWRDLKKYTANNQTRALARSQKIQFIRARKLLSKHTAALVIGSAVTAAASSLAYDSFRNWRNGK